MMTDWFSSRYPKEPPTILLWLAAIIPAGMVSFKGVSGISSRLCAIRRNQKALPWFQYWERINGPRASLRRYRRVEVPRNLGVFDLKHRNILWLWKTRYTTIRPECPVYS